MIAIIWSDPKGCTDGAYDAQDRLVQYGGVAYAYTEDGTLRSSTDTATGHTTTYTYDPLGNLVRVDLPDSRVIEYLIDGTQRRVAKIVDGVLARAWLYRDDGRGRGAVYPVAELDGAGNVVARFVYAADTAVPDYMVRSGVTYRFIKDQLGSVRAVQRTTDGLVLQRLDYDEFGVVVSDTNEGFQPFGFAGGLYDFDTGLARFRFRDYDARVGRWTAKDPLRFGSDSMNLYAYADGDPVNSRDEDGLNPLDTIAKWMNDGII